MALFSRLFQSKHRNHRNSSCKITKITEDSTWDSSNAMFDRTQMRLILFKDHDVRGRQLLFDSKGIQRAEEVKTPKRYCKFRKPPPTPETKSNKNGESAPQSASKYKFNRTSDTKLLGEMMFGSVAMTFKGNTLKVHTTRTPPQLMVSKVFLPTAHSRDSSGCDEDTYSLQSMSAEYGKDEVYVSHSVPMDVPSSIVSQSSADEDSGFAASMASNGSLNMSFPSPSSTPTNASINSLQYRRWMRNQTTSLEIKPRKRVSWESATSQTSVASEVSTSNSSVSNVRRQYKLGVAVIFNLFEGEYEANKLFQNFFFSHITLIESHVNKLRTGIEEAYFTKKNFLDLVFESFDRFCSGICDLYTTPRLSEPVWLNMMAYRTQKYDLCQRFMRDFMMVSEKYDTKSTNFFVSTLVTAVLSHHLAWVPTVTPAGASPSETYVDKHSAKWLDTLAKSHPYNPLWAQLGDLYGALGVPVRIARTVVVGKKTDLVNKFLSILSYFIRCSEVHDNIEIQVSDDQDSNSWQQFVVDEPQKISRGDMSPIREHPPSMTESVRLSNTEHPPLGGSETQTLRNNSECKPKSPPTLVDINPLTHGAFKNVNFNHDSQSTVVKMVSKSNFYSVMENVCLSQDDANNGVSFVRQNSNSTFYVALPSEIDDNIGSSENTPATTTKKCTSKAVLNEGNIAPLESTTATFEENLEERNSREYKPESVRLTHDVSITGKDGWLENCAKNCTVTESDKPARFVECRLSPTEVMKPRLEIIRHVGRVATESTMDNEIFGHPSSFDASIRGKGSTTLGDNESHPGKLHRMYSVQSTSSEFDEYFPGSIDPRMASQNDFDEYFSEGIETKTIDDLDDLERVEKYRHLKCNCGTRTERCRMCSSTGSDVLRGPKDDEQHIVFKESSKDMPGSAYIETGRDKSETYGTVSIDSAFMDGGSYYSSTEEGEAAYQDDCSDNAAETCDGDNRHRALQKTFSDTSAEVQTILRPTSLGRQESTNTDTTLTPTDEFRIRLSSFGRASVPGRCRSVTPTELNRRRHMSSSSMECENTDPFVDMKEMPLPKSEMKAEVGTITSYERNFGRSLLAGCATHYLSDFVLHGTTNTSPGKIRADLEMSTKDSILDESVGEAVCIVADTDNWTVNLVSSLRLQGDNTMTASNLIVSMVESVQDLWKLKMSPEFCLMHLEDRLQELYFNSCMLADYIRCEKKASVKELGAALGFDSSDLPLLLAVAGTHSSLGFGVL